MPSIPLPKTAPRVRKMLALVAAATAAPLALTGCMGSAKTPGAADGPIQVTSTQTECKVSASQVASGNLTFAVKNAGTQATDFYLLAEDGLRVIGEVENIGPGLSRNLVVTATAGKYTTACKPGMQGDGIRAGFKVTDSGYEPRRRRRAPGAPGHRHPAVLRLREGSDRPARGTVPRRSPRRTPPETRQGPRALCRHPHALGTH